MYEILCGVYEKVQQGCGWMLNERTAVLYENEDEDENKAAELLMNVERWAEGRRSQGPKSMLKG